MTGEVPRAIRPGRAGDVGLVLNSWLKGLARYRTSAEVEAGYYAAQKWIIATLLERSTVLVACAPADDTWCGETDTDPTDAIRGYAVGERHDDRVVMHWCYVKRKWRGDGIATDLVEALRQDRRRVVITHTTPAIERYAKARSWQVAPMAPCYLVIEAMASRRDVA